MTTFRRKFISLLAAAGAFGIGYFGFYQYQDARFARAEEQRQEMRQQLGGYLNDLANVYKTVGKVVEPSVVSINVRKKIPNPHTPDMFKHLFPDRDGDGKPDLPPGIPDHSQIPDEAPQGDSIDEIGTGSGVIVEADGKRGYILTNNHVAGGADQITITLNDGREIRNARLIGADPRSDLAVMEIRADRLSPAVWGNSDGMQKGDFVLAFGSPFGYVGSMTHGIVSALHRQAGVLGLQGYENFIQVDAPINPGNSGGPLVNLKGEVIGINIAIASATGGSQGVGFAIPSNQAQFVYRQLREKGTVTRGWVGIAIMDIAQDQALAKSFGYEGTHGVLVQEVLRGTPAFGNLEHGDIIITLDDKPILSIGQFRSAVASIQPGTEIHIGAFRAGKPVQVKLTLGRQSDDSAAHRPATLPDNPHQPAISPDDLGMKVKDLTKDLAQRYGVDLSEGALISEVARDTPAFRERLRVGDVITEVGGQKVRNAGEFNAAMARQDLGKGVRLYVQSREGGRYVLVSLDR